MGIKGREVIRRSQKGEEEEAKGDEKLTGNKRIKRSQNKKRAVELGIILKEITGKNKVLKQ